MLWLGKGNIWILLLLSYMIQDYLDVFLYFYVAQTLTLSNSWIALIFPTPLCLDVAMLKFSKALQL